MADVIASGEKVGDGGEAVKSDIEVVKINGETTKEETTKTRDGTANAQKDDLVDGQQSKVDNIDNDIDSTGVKKDDTANDNLQDNMDIVNDEKGDSASNKRSGPKSPSQERAGSPKPNSDDYESKRNGAGKRYRSNIKTRFDTLPESSDPDEIRHQVEFYFSDTNLPTDAFLLRETGGKANLPVDLKVIHNFKRMRHFQPYSAVRDAVKQSKHLLLDDNDMITRAVPLSDKFTDDSYENKKLVHSAGALRSIYAKGFGEETSSTHLDIEAFFAPYGTFNSIRLRRADDGTFKGSVFVEFVDNETQQRFLQLDPKPQWEGKDLKIMSKMEYVDLKHDGILEGLVKPQGHRSFNDRYYRGKGYDRRFERPSYKERGEMRGKNGRWEQEDWKERRNRDQERDRDQEDDRRERRTGPGRGRGRGRGKGNRGGRGNRFGRDRDRDSDHRRDRSGDRGAGRGDSNDLDNTMEKRGSENKQRDDEKDAGGSQDAGKESQVGAGAEAGDDTAMKAGSERKKRSRDEDDETGPQSEAKNKKVKNGEVETEEVGAGAEVNNKKGSRGGDDEDGVQGTAKNKKAKKDDVESEKVRGESEPGSTKQVKKGEVQTEEGGG